MFGGIIKTQSGTRGVQQSEARWVTKLKAKARSGVFTQIWIGSSRARAPHEEYAAVFRPEGRIDPVGFARWIEAAARGAKDGHDLVPPPDATELPPAISDFAIYAKKLLDAVLIEQRGTLLEMKQALEQACAKSLRPILESLLRDTKNNGDAALQRWLKDWLRATARRATAERDYEAYKIDNGLNRDARQPPDMLWFLVIAVVFVVAESILNYKMFEDSTANGALGGLMIAGAMSLFNILVSVLAGFTLGRLCLRVQRRPRLWGIAGTVLFGLTMLTAHGLFATFRAITASGIDVGVALNSIYEAQNLRVAAGDGLSLVLVVVGGLISAISFWKGTKLSEPEPGFLRLWREREAAREAEEAMEAAISTEQDAIKLETLSKLDTTTKEETEQEATFDRQLGELQTLKDQHESTAAEVNAALGYAVDAYWSANRRGRINGLLPDLRSKPVAVLSSITPLAFDVSEIVKRNAETRPANMEAIAETRRFIEEDALARLAETRAQLIEAESQPEAVVRHLHAKPLAAVA